MKRALLFGLIAALSATAAVMADPQPSNVWSPTVWRCVDAASGCIQGSQAQAAPLTWTVPAYSSVHKGLPAYSDCRWHEGRLIHAADLNRFQQDLIHARCK